MMTIAPILLIVGFIIFLGGGLAAPPRVYQESEISAKLEIISRFSFRWKLSNYLGGFGGLIISLGFIALLLQIGSEPPSLVWIGIFLLTISTVAVIISSLRRAGAPEKWLAMTGIMDYVWLFSFMAGIVVIGYILFRLDFPRWLSLGTMASVGLLAVLSLIFNLAIAEISYLIPLVLGIFLLIN